MPYINRPYKPSFRILSSLLGTSYIDPPLDAASTQSIDLALWPSHVDSSGRVHFCKSVDLPQGGGMRRIEEERMKGREVRPDLVVFATGYKQEWGWLGEGESLCVRVSGADRFGRRVSARTERGRCARGVR